MIAPYVAAAIAAPLRDRPNHLVAEIRHIEQRDRVSPFEAALSQWARQAKSEQELSL